MSCNRTVGTAWRVLSLRRAWRGRRARAASRRGARCRRRQTATPGATQVPPGACPTPARLYIPIRLTADTLHSTQSASRLVRGRPRRPTAGLDPARNTTFETRTFSRVRSLSLYCHYFYDFLALSTLYFLTHFPQTWSLYL